MNAKLKQDSPIIACCLGVTSSFLPVGLGKVSNHNGYQEDFELVLL